ncbi:MAG: hypothetical protein K0R76_764 [Alphaproteobacteria bacterium]|jgi:hypothetical protein|nr:hypothetical protein [Alphaproteobacteria bacterium]
MKISHYTRLACMIVACSLSFISGTFAADGQKEDLRGDQHFSTIGCGEEDARVAESRAVAATDGEIAGIERAASSIKEEEQYLKALSRLQEMDDEYNKQPKEKVKKDALIRGIPDDCLGGICQYLDEHELISIRTASKSLYYSEAGGWFGICLANGSTNHIRHLSSPFSASQIRAALCIRRRLLQPHMILNEDELSFISHTLREDTRFEIAAAYLEKNPAMIYTNLVQLAQKGSAHAQILIVSALFKGDLGQHARPERERYDELKAWGLRSDPSIAQEAMYCLASALYLGLEDIYSPEDRFRELQDLAQQGYQAAQEGVAKAIYEGELGQGSRSSEERFRELQDLAQQGNQKAQELIVKAVYEGNLGQAVRSPDERFRELQDLAQQGDQEAQKLIVKAIYEGELGQGVRIPQERFRELQDLAQQGNPEAQECVIRAIYYDHIARKFGQDDRVPEERFRELQNWARQGDQEAEKYVAEAIYEGKLGQGVRSPEQRFEDLLSQLRQGNKEALYFMIRAVYEGKLGQGTRSLEERFKELQELALIGNQEAQFLVYDVVRNGELGQKACPEAVEQIGNYYKAYKEMLEAFKHKQVNLEK